MNFIGRIGSDLKFFILYPFDEFFDTFFERLIVVRIFKLRFNSVFQFLFNFEMRKL